MIKELFVLIEDQNDDFRLKNPWSEGPVLFFDKTFHSCSTTFDISESYYSFLVHPETPEAIKKILLSKSDCYFYTADDTITYKWGDCPPVSLPINTDEIDEQLREFTIDLLRDYLTQDTTGINYCITEPMDLESFPILNYIVTNCCGKTISAS